MWKSRRIFLQLIQGVWAGGILQHCGSLHAFALQPGSDDALQTKLTGRWKLHSYTYTSNGRTYQAPQEMEATANFSGGRYDVAFATYISAVGIRRTRRASESGTYTAGGNRITLTAKEASDDAEMGQELLLDVRIEDGRMLLKSNNGVNEEVWEKA